MCDASVWDNFTNEVRKKRMAFKHDDTAHRLERAISWGKKSCEMKNEPQIQFICLFIAMDALSGQRETVHKFQATTDPFRKTKTKTDFNMFKDKIMEENKDKMDTVMEECRIYIARLFELRYAYDEFWHAIYCDSKRNKWESKYAKDSDDYAHRKLSTEDVFDKIFSRLRVVRNQVMHGSMTYGNKSFGGTQVRLSVSILNKIIPCMIEIMIESRTDWGYIPYPHAGKAADDISGKPPKRDK